MSQEKLVVDARQGFSLLEMLAVVAIIAIIAMIAVPSLWSRAPYTSVRTSVSGITTSMQQARLKAANSQKPVRVVVNCSGHVDRDDPPCTLRLDIAVFKADGSFDSWEFVNGSFRELSSAVSVSAVSGSTAVSGNPNRIFWAVFFPSSTVSASHDPFAVQVRSDVEPAALRELTLNRLTGRVTSVKVDI